VTAPLWRSGRPSPGVAWVRKLQRERTAARRYGVALGATAIAVLGGFAIVSVADVHTNLLLVTAVAISAWYGGRGPGALASALSVIAIVIPFGRGDPAAIDVPGVREATYLATFLVVTLIIGATTESLRRERAQAVARAALLEDLNTEVEQQVEEVRTLSEHLQQSNDCLAAALATAEDTASRGMRLQEATAALAKAQTESEVADVVLGKGLAAVGAARGFLARADGDRVEIVRACGYEPEVTERLLGPTGDLPLLAQAVQTGEAVWIRSVEENRARNHRMYERLGITAIPHASASIPLRHGDEVVGALGLFFVAPSAVGAATEAFSLLLGQAAADALWRARSFDAERAGREKAEVLAQARADVLGIVAHDLRNPLHLIAASAGLLLETEDLPPARRRRPLEITQRAVRQMNRLIGDLLDTTHLEAGRLTLALRDIDAYALVREAGETLRPAAEERRIELRADTPEREAMLRADEDRLLQVLGNLVGNALKFTAAGGRVVISARPAGVEIVFSVADNGPGIPQEHQAHLFDRFWQARDGDRRGVGLGLAITKGIVEAHGGRVWVESAVGAGSTFSFAIPTALDALAAQIGRGAVTPA
jgi:signal transduction histidine kinase